jgi:hypothetical protein
VTLCGASALCSDQYDYDDRGVTYCIQIVGHEGFHFDDHGNRWTNEDDDEGW